MSHLHQIAPAFLQKRFNLTYHIPYLQLADKKVGLVGQKVLEVGGSLPHELVIDILGADAWIGVEETGYWNAVPDNGYGSKHGTPPRDSDLRRLELCPGIAGLRPRDVLEGAIENLPATLENTFDRVFSIACFEHIHQMPEALNAMYRALRPGGLLFTMYSPIWSAHDGHHLSQMTDSQGRPIHTENDPVRIAPWAHLLLSPEQMVDHLDAAKYDLTTRLQIVENLYHNPHINRFFSEDYFRFFQQSPFTIVEAITTFPYPIPPDIQAALEAKYPGRTQFANNGILAILQKPA